MSGKAVHSIDPEWIKKELNEPQSQAVTTTEGPVLVLAGAGSGKTRVLTYRIAYLLACGLASPAEILAMTFTNKAAAEMRERVSRLAPNMMPGLWIGTFHSLFARLLRREGECIGYDRNFSIYDEYDQNTLVKQIIEDLKLDTMDVPTSGALHRISDAKNNLVSPQDYLNNAQHPIEEFVAKVYKEYQIRLRNMNAMDFDDLLLNPIELFERFPLVREFYQDKFHYILVDEYQDTNRAQYVMLKYLAQKHKNICVVGDDDQSIYRWRGAEIRNILDFEKDYATCSKFRLEQNYRSTQNILSAAHSVITNNRQRHAKKLWTEGPVGEPVMVLEVYDDLEEARTIVDKISYEFRRVERNFHDFAILYRTNAQSRVLEEALRTEGIPYIIVGGVKFYERKEVKDVLGYLKVLVNPADAISLRRIINFPARGIGEASLAKLDGYARHKKIMLYEALSHVGSMADLPKRISERVLAFSAMMNKYRSLMSKFSPFEIASAIVEENGILRMLKEENTIESISRAENVRELLSAIADFANSVGPEATLEDFLEHVSLSTDIDKWDDKANAVTLMTLHSAKGLEFPVVYITGLEEGLFPLSRSLSDMMALEEERRLFYVGATRSKDMLYLSWARYRRRYGERLESVKSRFLKELDPEFVRIDNLARPYYGKHATTDEQSYQDTMPDYEDESQERLEFRPGVRVRHPMFGKGTVIQIDAAGSNVKLLVLFDTAGRKRLVLPYAKLEIL